VTARPGITAAGRRRVATALERTGMLLVQGQAEIPSVADLLADRRVTTRGFSWDYEPAWRLTAEYDCSGTDVAVVKLFRGRRTLVHRRLWPAVDALAHAGQEQLRTRPATDVERRFVDLVERSPGIASNELRESLRADRRAFDRAKRNAEQWLCTFGRARDDVDHHTHEPALFPWSEGTIARSQRRRARLAFDHALAALLASIDQERAGRPGRIFPVVALAGQSG
jgi:hypothetical protein